MTEKMLVEGMKEKIEFNHMEQLLYDLLFSKKSIFNIDLQFYCTFETRSKFRDDLRRTIKKGGLKILDDRIIHTNETIIWKIELNK